MAQIDELISAMVARRADALILSSDQPAQLNFAGQLASGAMVPAHLLRAMLQEIVPMTQINQLHAQGEWSLSYNCASGAMDVTVERRGPHLKLIVVPSHSPTNIFTPPQTPAPTFQTYQPPVDSSFAPPPAPPTYNAAPVPGYSVPMVTSHAPYPNTAYPSTGYAPAVHTAYSSLPPAKPEISPQRTIFRVFFIGVLASLFLPVSVLPPLLLFFTHQFFGLALLATLAAALVVLVDARALGVRRGLVDGFADWDAQGWFFVTLALGLLGVPLYLIARPTYKRALQSQLKRLKP